MRKTIKTTCRQVNYEYVNQHQQQIVDLCTSALLTKHEATKLIYIKLNKQEKMQFKQVCDNHVIDMLQQTNQHDGMFFVAESTSPDMEPEVIAISIGMPCKPNHQGLSTKFFEQAAKQSPHFLEVLKPWGQLMEAYQISEDDLPQGKLYEQNLEAVHPDYTYTQGQDNPRNGIGSQLMTTVISTLKDKGYDAAFTVTSSRSAEGMMRKFQKEIQKDNSISLTQIDELKEEGLKLVFAKFTPRGEQALKWFAAKKAEASAPGSEFFKAVKSGNYARVVEVYKKTTPDVNQYESFNIPTGFRITSTPLLEAATLDDGSRELSGASAFQYDPDNLPDSIKIMKFLIDKGADIKAQTQELGHSVLHAAAFFGNVFNLMFLIEECGFNPLVIGGVMQHTAVMNALYKDPINPITNTKLRAAAYLISSVFKNPLLVKIKDEDLDVFQKMYCDLKGINGLKINIAEKLQHHWPAELDITRALDDLTKLDQDELNKLAELIKLTVHPKLLEDRSTWLGQFYKNICATSPRSASTPTTKKHVGERAQRFARYQATIDTMEKLQMNRLGYPTTFAQIVRGKFENGKFILASRTPQPDEPENLIPSGPLGLENSIFRVFFNNVGSPESDTATWQQHTKEYEKELIEILRDYFGMTQAATGYVTNGGTEGNDAALLWHKKHAVNKTQQLHPNTKVNPIVISSKEAHYSVKKSASDKMGLKHRVVDCDDDGAIKIDSLTKLLEELNSDESVSSQPIIMVVTAGTTRQSAIDPIDKIAKLLKSHCAGKRSYSIHLDAAFYALCIPIETEYKAENSIFRYVETVSFSGHKFLGMTFPCGVVLSTQQFCEEAYATTDTKVSYIGTHDTTYSGSRNGHSVLIMHNILHELDLHKDPKIRYKKLTELIRAGKQAADRFYRKLKTILPASEHRYLQYSERGHQIIFPMPADNDRLTELMREYQLMPIVREGQPRCAGASIYFSVHSDTIDSFISSYAKARGLKPTNGIVQQRVFKEERAHTEKENETITGLNLNI